MFVGVEAVLYFFLAYTVIWVGLLGFVMSISGRQKQLAADLALIEDLLEENSRGAKDRSAP